MSSPSCCAGACALVGFDGRMQTQGENFWREREREREEPPNGFHHQPHPASLQIKHSDFKKNTENIYSDEKETVIAINNATRQVPTHRAGWLGEVDVWLPAFCLAVAHTPLDTLTAIHNQNSPEQPKTKQPPPQPNHQNSTSHKVPNGGGVPYTKQQFTHLFAEVPWALGQRRFQTI